MFIRAKQIMITVARLSLQTVLVPLAPLVRVTCAAAVLLGVLTCVVFEVSAASAKFPLLEMLVLVFGFVAFALAYHALLAFLNR